MKITYVTAEIHTELNQYPVLRVQYNTDEDDELVEDLPMIWVPDDEDQPGEWTVNTKGLSPLHAQLWEALGDAACAEEECRIERHLDGL